MRLCARPPFQPDIRQNTGAILPLGARFGIAVDIIGLCGFMLDDHHLKRAAIDYLDHVILVRHTSWDASRQSHGGQLVLLSTNAHLSYHRCVFTRDDALLPVQETAGVPQEVAEAVDVSVLMPTRPRLRLLNAALAAALMLDETLRQTALLPEPLS